MITGGAGRRDARVRAAEAEADGDMAGGEVRKDRRNKERADPTGSLLQQNLVRVLQAGDAAHAGPDKDADAARFHLRSSEMGAIDRHNGGGQRIVNKPVHLLDLFLLHIEKRVKSLALCSDLRIVATGVEPCDMVD